MKVTVNFDCSPEEARAFLGLPNVEPINEFLVEQMKSRIEQNIGQMQPEEVMKTWSNFGVQAQDQFFKLMQTAAKASMTPFSGS